MPINDEILSIKDTIVASVDLSVDGYPKHILRQRDIIIKGDLKEFGIANYVKNDCRITNSIKEAVK